MSGVMDRITGLSAGVKVALVAVVLLLLVGVSIVVFDLGVLATVVLVVGLVLVGVLLLVFLVVLAAIRKRKAAPFEAELAANTGAVPDGISEAASRARMDDLRQRFEQGVQTFRQHGKDLYSLPWYVIVGEPGSGKTEVLRHSNIGFPPGLQDELQGSGGTINMDWWFTNQAVILDTAGRLMFEDAAQTGGNSEWNEFLKLLARNRPNCPINGLMLVIPADSLIKDSGNEIDDKARRIARQLDVIQRTLDVRFPVFILITKSDLINGFREFFDGLDDPQLQHQILGWSNPQELDAPFDPTGVQDHLLNIEDRLLRRRFGLMVDPVAREGAQARRLDEVDAMYALPEAMTGVAPRLRRYLEHIFPAGEWSAKPLFLRGLYFVSSMREGSALDADLAEAMGVPLEELPDARIWERDRSYFIRDLFLNKMFREKGLVTRASNTRELRRRRRLALFGVTSIAAMLLIALSVFQASALRKSVAEPRDFWTAIGRVYGPDRTADEVPAIIGGEDSQSGDEGLRYRGDDAADPSDRLRRDGSSLTRVLAAEAIAEEVERTISVPTIFRPAMFFVGGGTDLLGGRRLDAGRAAYERSILEPIVRRASQSLDTKTFAPGERRTAVSAAAAMIELIRAADDPSRPVPSLEPLLAWTLRPSVALDGTDDQYVAATASIATLDSSLRTLADGRSGRQWLRAAIRNARPRHMSDLAQVIETLGESWVGEFTGTGDSTLAKANSIGEQMKIFREAEDEIFGSYAPAQGVGEKDLTVWLDAYPKLAAAATSLRADVGVLDGTDFATYATAAADGGSGETDQELEILLGALPGGSTSGAAADAAGAGDDADATDGAESSGASPSADADDAGSADHVTGGSSDDETLRRFRRTLTEAQARLESLRAANRTKLEGYEQYQGLLEVRSGIPAFDRHAAMYEKTEALRGRSFELNRISDLPVRFTELKAAGEAQQSANNSDADDALETDPLRRVAKASNHIIDLASDAHREALVTEAQDTWGMPAAGIAVPGIDQVSVDAIVATIVRERAEYDFEPIVAIPMTVPEGEFGEGGAFYATFHSVVGPAVVEAFLDAEAVLRDRGTAAAVANADRLRRALDQWVFQYAAYWGQMLTDDGHISWTKDDDAPSSQPGSKWGAFVRRLEVLDPDDVNVPLQTLLARRRAAIAAIVAIPTPSAPHPDLVGADGAWSPTTQQALSTVDADLEAMFGEFVGLDVTLPDDVDRWREAWMGLGTDVQTARQALLGKTRDRFNSDFLVLAKRKKTQRVDFYRTLTIAALEALAAEATAASTQAREDIVNGSYFPLRRLSPELRSIDALVTEGSSSARQLSMDAFANARDSMELLRPSEDDDAAADDRVGSAGGYTHPIREVEDAIRALRGGDEALDRALINRIDTVMQALPKPGETAFVCTVTLLGDRDTPGHVRATDRFPGCRLNPGADETGSWESSQDERVVLGTIDFPNTDGDISIEMRRTPSGSNTAVVHTETISGPWSALALIHRFADGTSRSDDGKTWTIEVLIEDQTETSGSTFAFWLELAFNEPLPELDAWPGTDD